MPKHMNGIRRRTAPTNGMRPTTARAFRTLGLGLTAAVMAVGFFGEALEAEPTLHLRLERTEPAGDEVVTEAPAEIRLFFSEAPQMRGTTVRLADAAGELVATTGATADEDDPREVYIRPDGELADGPYTVHWRVIAQDGHAQNGTFEFRVQTTR
jgi:copper resistance protein C